MGIATVGPSPTTSILGALEEAGGNGGVEITRQLKILLADDDHEIRKALAQTLSSRGFSVHEVSDGVSLLDSLSPWLLEEADTPPPADVIVTDVRMPGINGMTIVEGLRASGWTGPIVVMSAFGDDVIRHRIARMTDVVFLDKPFDLSELEQTLDHLTQL